MTTDTSHHESPEQQFAQELQAYGLKLPSTPLTDGHIHRVPCPHDKGHAQSGRYFLHVDGHLPNGAYGCFHEHPDNGLGVSWSSQHKSRYTRQDRAYLAAQAQKHQARLASEAAHKVASAQALYNNATPCTEHEYLTRKRIVAHAGLRVTSDNILLIPLYKPTESTIQAVQRIYPLDYADETYRAQKRFKGSSKDGVYTINSPDQHDTTVITTGYATGATIAQALGCHVVCAFSDGQLLSVAQHFKQTLPTTQRIIIASDNDQFKPHNSGLVYGTQAAQAIEAAFVMPSFEGLDVSHEPTDFNDLYALAGIEAVRTALQAVPIEPTHDAPTDWDSMDKSTVKKATLHSFEQIDGVPKGYVVNRKGVYCVDEAGDSLWLCSRLDVVAMTRDRNGNDWGRLLRWHDADRAEHQWATPVNSTIGQGYELQKVLMAQGLRVDSRAKQLNLLAKYVASCEPTARARCVNKTGWYNDVYVLPHRTIGKSHEMAIYQTSDDEANPYSTKGTLALWREHVASLCVGNSRCVLSVSMAFAGVLLPLAGIEGGGVHFIGSSSKGKSTVIKAAASVFGASAQEDMNRFLCSWKTTDNAVEGMAALRNNSLLILDELRLASPKTVGDTIYMLSAGAGKARANRSGTGRAVRTWQLLYLSNGEIDLKQHMGEAGKVIHAGQEIRFAEIQAEVPNGFGVFEQLHGHANGAMFAQTLNAATSEYYGTAGVAFIERCTQHKSRIMAEIGGYIEQFIATVLPPDAEGQAHRVAQRFGLIAVAGEYASEWGITGWPKGEATAAAIRCYQDWVESRPSGYANQEKQAMLESVRSYILRYGDSKFSEVEAHHDNNPLERAGWRRRSHDANGQARWEYLFIPDVFKKQVCAGLSVNAVLKTLHEEGFLRTSIEGGRLRRATKQTIGQFKLHLYVVNGRLLEG
ncbi:DUF927 domain-containing protein [Hydromonas duriensis]|uniref:Putative DNA primase/helicase n=1 Tax=Hydromonas duriensis TaxID=1527608 RepID=A0A4R6Y0U1_9BURK|nr:DUF927 domain-containing protein [Hydromonas duriensis]TDR27861.1 putative DNA primase/helicase [Hydromonas duriensis]